MTARDVEHTKQECPKDVDNARMTLRARENKKEWGTKQLFKCCECGRRWSE